MTGHSLGTGDSEGLLADNFRKSRSTLFLLALAYLVFVIYGSLVPLHFHGRPLAEAWQDFLHIRYLSLGIGSRADWVANILLFIPLAFLWLGVLWHRRSFLLRAAAALLVLGAGVGLSVGIEFTQLFFPPRTVSLNDILAEGIGAVVGIVTWWATGPRVFAWFEAWRGARAPLDIFGRALYLYLFFFFAYNLLPLDLTVSPVEIYHKWQEGRVVLSPFSFVFESREQAVYGLVTDVLVWVPIAFLWRLSTRKGPLRAWFALLLLPVVLEVLQLFVYSRVTDVSDILSGAVGIGVGAWLSRMWGGGENDSGRDRAHHLTRFNKAPWIWFGLAMIWALAVAAIFWYPFDFHIGHVFVRERLQAAMERAPFEIYYYGTEYRAATEVLHKILFFAPAGVLLGLARLRIRRYGFRAAAGIGFVAFLAALPALVELGQLLLPGKFADGTDWLLETTGGLAGYAAVLALRHRSSNRPAIRRTGKGGRGRDFGESFPPAASGQPAKPTASSKAEVRCLRQTTGE